MSAAVQPMRHARARGGVWAGWAVTIVTLLLLAAAVPLFVSVSTQASVRQALGLTRLDFVIAPLNMLFLAAVAVIGCLIITRQPGHLVGWVLAGYSLAAAMEGFCMVYAFQGLLVSPGSLPGALAAGWLQSWLWIVSYGLMGVFLPLLFPNGQLPSPRWRPLAWIGAGSMLAGVIGAALQAGPLGNSLHPLDIHNPLGVLDPQAALFIPLGFGWFIVLNLGVLAAAASLFTRLRRATPDERQQIKWLAYFIVLGAALLVLQALVRHILQASTPEFETVFAIVSVVQGAGVPVAAGLAILKHRLYDIDLIIRRTLVYAALSAALLLCYFGSVVLLQTTFRAVAGREQTELVTVVSTLAIAGLFTPLRQRIQTGIDRRFYRRRYDAAATLAAFGARLRDDAHADLGLLSDRILEVVGDTMQPAHASLWLRPAPQAGRKPGQPVPGGPQP
jgi:hypothetical protein